MRISNFLLWQLAYTEIFVTSTYGRISVASSFWRSSTSFRAGSGASAASESGRHAADDLHGTRSQEPGPPQALDHRTGGFAGVDRVRGRRRHLLLAFGGLAVLASLWEYFRIVTPAAPQF